MARCQPNRRHVTRPAPDRQAIEVVGAYRILTPVPPGERWSGALLNQESHRECDPVPENYVMNSGSTRCGQRSFPVGRLCGTAGSRRPGPWWPRRPGGPGQMSISRPPLSCAVTAVSSPEEARPGRSWWENPASTARRRVWGRCVRCMCPGWPTDAAGTLLRDRERQEAGLSGLGRLRCLLDEWSPRRTVFLRSCVWGSGRRSQVMQLTIGIGSWPVKQSFARSRNIVVPGFGGAST